MLMRSFILIVAAVAIFIIAGMPAAAQACIWTGSLYSNYPAYGYGSGGYSLGCPGCPGCPDNPMTPVPGEPVCYGFGCPGCPGCPSDNGTPAAPGGPGCLACAGC